MSGFSGAGQAAVTSEACKEWVDTGRVCQQGVIGVASYNEGDLLLTVSAEVPGMSDIFVALSADVGVTLPSAGVVGSLVHLVCSGIAGSIPSVAIESLQQ
eukprot:451683-Rhodomonas_salina.1